MTLTHSILNKMLTCDNPYELGLLADMLSGPECVDAHNLLWRIDQELKTRWAYAGKPTPERLEPTFARLTIRLDTEEC